MPRTQTIDPEVLPPDNGLSTNTAEALHNHYHRCAQVAAAQATGYAILCGLELKKIRAKLAKPGKRSDLDHSGGRGWKEWVKENCEYGHTTAMKYIAVADGVSARIGSKLDGLMDLAPSELNEKQHEKLLKTVSKSTQGQTLQQLYLDFGIVKANPNDNLKKGGKTHTKGRPGKDVDKELAKEQAADLSHRLARFLQDGDHQLLTKRDLADFDDALLAARETIKPFRK